jgi:adenylate cyclase
MFEIERKFLVTAPIEAILKTANRIQSLDIAQVYMKDTGEWTQRVREIKDRASGLEKYVFTMKKKVNDLRCIEMETRVSRGFYDAITTIATPPLLKTRHDILCGATNWHVDVFHDVEFDGLIVAEIELVTEDDDFPLPEWLGEEVTTDKRYKNARMARKLDELRNSTRSK